MSPLVTDLARPTVIDGPQDPELALRWNLALAKFEAEYARAPASREEWRAITREYRRLLGKPGGSIAQIIEQRCSEVPGGD